MKVWMAWRSSVCRSPIIAAASSPTPTSIPPSFSCPRGFLHGALLRHRYDLIYIHNMPDILVFSALVPKAFGAKVILDQHDPMPELMMTIFNLKAGQS